MIQDPQAPEYNFVGMLPTPPRRRRNLPIVVSIVLVLVIAFGSLFALVLWGAQTTPNSGGGNTHTIPTPNSGGNTHPTPNSGGGSVTSAQATAVVRQYYAHINAGDYQDAYALWGTSYQRTTSYATFSQGFANTQHSALQQGTAIALSDGTVRVPVTITATQADVDSTTVNTYQGYYIVGQEQGSAKLLSADLQLTNSSNTRVKQAIGVLTQYYTYINARDYQDAYNLWGQAYHSTTTYQQFVAGFANTRSVSFSVLPGTAVLKEGSVQIPVTIRSLDTTQSGTATHIYRGYYIIGTEGNTWQLFSANIQ